VIVGSTIVVFLAKGNEACVMWAGDSRLYRFRAGELQQLTEDHAWHDSASPDSVGSAVPPASRSNVITRAIGAYPELKLDTVWLDIDPLDRYLLCSDGLDKELSPADIRTIMSQATQAQACVDELMTLAIERGARDNVTTVVIFLTHDTPAAG
jgi:type VI secretion system protein ImpM